MVRFVSVVFLLVSFSLSALAEEIKVWTPTGGPRLILPVGTNQTPEEAAARYLEKIYDSSALGPAMLSEWLSEVTGTFEDLPERGNGGPIMVLLDNSFERHKEDVRVFNAQGADTYLLPLGAELALKTEAERARFRTKLAKSIDGMVLLGGHDIDPRLYGSRNTYSTNTAHARDEMEMAYAKALLGQSNGRLFGICRGQQMIGVTFGYKLHQDIEENLGAADHVDVNHRIHIDEGTHLSHALDGRASAQIYSLHHQAIDMDSNPRGKLVATATSAIDDVGVIEAVESKDGRVFAVQFHPELMSGAVGKAVIKKFVKLAKDDAPNCFQRIAGLRP